MLYMYIYIYIIPLGSQNSTTGVGKPHTTIIPHFIDKLIEAQERSVPASSHRAQKTRGTLDLSLLIPELVLDSQLL